MKVKGKNLNEERAEQVLAEGMLLAEQKWGDFIQPLMEAYQKKRGISLPQNLIATTSMCLENLDSWFLGRGLNARKIAEDTYPDAVGNFIHYGFEVITALIPSLAIEGVVSIQPMDRKIGEAFFLNFIKDTTKGSSVAGDSYLHSKTGWGGDYLYTTPYAEGEIVATLGAPAATANGIITNIPLKANTITLYINHNSAVVELTDDGAGAWTGLANVSGNIDYATGIWNVDVSGCSPTTMDVGNVIMDYTYDMDRGMPPSVSLEIESLPLTATPRRCRTNWLMESAIDLQKAHGKDVDEELLTAVIGGISNEISVEVFQMLLDGATAGTFSWDKRPTDTGILQKHWNEMLVNHCVTMANAIYAVVRRGYGNVIVGGTNFCDIVEALPSTYFKAESDYKNPPSGPHRIGTLAGRFTVIKNLEYPTDKFLMGYKGDTYLDAGFVYAPYIPIYTTNPVALDDTKVRRGIGTSSAKKMINTDMYAIGRIYESTPP